MIAPMRPGAVGSLRARAAGGGQAAGVDASCSSASARWSPVEGCRLGARAAPPPRGAADAPGRRRGVADLRGRPVPARCVPRQSGRLVGRNARLYLWSLLLLAAALVVPVGLAFGMKALGLPTILTMLRRDVALRPAVRGRERAPPRGASSSRSRCGGVGRRGTGAALPRRRPRHQRRAAWRPCGSWCGCPLGAVRGARGARDSRGAPRRARAMLPEGNAGVALLALGVGQVVVWTRLAFQVAGTRFAAALVETLAAAPPAVGRPRRRPPTSRDGLTIRAGLDASTRARRAYPRGWENSCG